MMNETLNPEQEHLRASQRDRVAQHPRHHLHGALPQTPWQENATRGFQPESTLRPPPHTLHPTPYVLYPAPYTQHPTPYTLHPTPHTLHPTPYTLRYDIVKSDGARHMGSTVWVGLLEGEREASAP